MNSFKLARFFLYLVPLSVALVMTSTLFPFIVGKYAWFRTAVDLSLISLLVGLLIGHDAKEYMTRLKEVWRRPLVIAVTLFVLIFLLAGFFGVNPSFSFWSSFERGEGGFQLLHLWLFFMLLLVLFRDERDWRRLFGYALAGGVLMSLYGLLAANGVQGFIGPLFDNPDFRFQGSIGNPAYVAAISIFLLFYTAYLWFGEYRKKRFSSFSSWLLMILGAGFLAVFFAAGTRGAFLGLVAAGVAFFGYFIFMHRTWRKWFALSLIVLVLAAGALVYFKDSAAVRALPVSRIFDISFSAQSFQDRTIMWETALRGWQERPLLGWGPENFLAVFDTRFDPRYFNPERGFGAWFDRAHSIYFDYLVETGILGILSFLAIFVTFYTQLFRRIRKNDDAFSPAVGGLLFAFPIAYLVQGIVLFDVLTIYLNVFLFLAFAAFLFRTRDIS